MAEDARRVAAAVAAIGDGRLALDANNAYHSVAEARAVIEAFQVHAPLWWFGEPLSPDAIAATRNSPASARDSTRTW